MIKLDENTWIASADDVRAIRAGQMAAPRGGAPGAWVEDPNRCHVLVNGSWFDVERGADAILDALTMGAGVAIEAGKGLGDEERVIINTDREGGCGDE